MSLKSLKLCIYVGYVLILLTYLLPCIFASEMTWTGPSVPFSCVYLRWCDRVLEVELTSAMLSLMIQIARFRLPSVHFRCCSK